MDVPEIAFIAMGKSSGVIYTNKFPLNNGPKCSLSRIFFLIGEKSGETQRIILTIDL